MTTHAISSLISKFGDNIYQKKDRSLWPEIEEALKDYFESGFKIDDYVDFLGGKTHIKYYPLKLLIRDAIISLLSRPDGIDYIVDNIVNSQPGRGFESELFKYISLSGNDNSLRSSNGSVLPLDFYKKTQSKGNLKSILMVISKKDDIETLDVLYGVPQYKKLFSGDSVVNFLTGIDLDPSSSVYSKLMGKSDEVSLEKYLDYQIAMTAANPVDSAMKGYNKSFSSEYGHVLIAHAMKSWSLFSSKAQLAIIKQSVEDGADWYMAYKQATVSPCIYLELQDRQRNPVIELAEVLSEWNDNPGTKRNTIVLKHILAAIPQTILDAVSEDPALGKRIRLLMKDMANESKAEMPGL